MFEQCRQTIEIPRAQMDPVPVAADCAGGLAVHKALPGNRWKWTVTHVGSGMCLERIGANTKAAALANMHAALALPFDWTKGERETLDALRMSRGIVDAITKIGERQ